MTPNTSYVNDSQKPYTQTRFSTAESHPTAFSISLQILQVSKTSYTVGYFARTECKRIHEALGTLICGKLDLLLELFTSVIPNHTCSFHYSSMPRSLHCHCLISSSCKSSKGWHPHAVQNTVKQPLSHSAFSGYLMKVLTSL